MLGLIEETGWLVTNQELAKVHIIKGVVYVVWLGVKLIKQSQSPYFTTHKWERLTENISFYVKIVR